MKIRIEATDLPGDRCGPSPERPEGHHGIHVGVQRVKPRDELLDMVPASVASATWTLECTATRTPNGVDIKGPYVQGRPGGRFIYLSWGTVDNAGEFSMFRRAKLVLGEVPAEVMESAFDTQVLVGRLGLTDHKGNPLCASVSSSAIEWVAARS